MTSLRLRGQSCAFLDDLQRNIVARLEALGDTGSKFNRTSISSNESALNTSYILQRTDNGRTPPEPDFVPLEKAILTMTQVKNRMPPNMPADFLKGQGARNPNVTTPSGGTTFFAVNLTVFVHPRSPHAPTGHGTWRYFEILDANDTPIDWWFGGASNLTPSYIYYEDCEHFHKTFKEGASAHGEHTYALMKKWCDEYFYNPYRKEQCGIGGIFFDGLSDKPHPKLDIDQGKSGRPKSPQECFSFFKATGDSFVSAYIPILERRALQPWTQEERNWQLIRRARFVEFCLLVDEGVKFGIQTASGSLDAILLILPETAQWVHQADRSDLSEQQLRLESMLKQPREWA